MTDTSTQMPSWLSDGEKYGLIGLEVKTEGQIPQGAITPNFCVLTDAIFSIPPNWRDWLGSIRAGEIKHCNLFLFSKQASSTPETSRCRKYQAQAARLEFLRRAVTRQHIRACAPAGHADRCSPERRDRYSPAAGFRRPRSVHFQAVSAGSALAHPGSRAGSERSLAHWRWHRCRPAIGGCSGACMSIPRPARPATFSTGFTNTVAASMALSCQTREGPGSSSGAAPSFS